MGLEAKCIEIEAKCMEQEAKCVGLEAKCIEIEAKCMEQEAKCATVYTHQRDSRSRRLLHNQPYHHNKNTSSYNDLYVGTRKSPSCILGRVQKLMFWLVFFQIELESFLK